MTSAATVIRSRRIAFPEGIREGTLIFRDGRIAEAMPGGAPPTGGALEDLGDRVVMPGLVDSHVHVNEPGRTEWEGFETATRAAAAGGITTIVDMPLNSIPPTTSRAGLRTKKDLLSQKAPRIDVALWGGVVPGNADQLGPMIDEGVRGFKCFLLPSGVDEFQPASEADLRRAMPILTERGAVLLVHAELQGPIDAAPRDGDPRRHDTFLRSRPREAENEAIRMMIRLAREFGCRVHIVHLSSADMVEHLTLARLQGTPISAETCPHYLTFESGLVPEGCTFYKCCPPIREAENRELLWAALREGQIDMVVSDHSPAPPSMKHLESGDFRAAWGGISSLQFLLPATWTEARRRGLPLERLPEWLCTAPARLAGLEGRKGRIAAGYDADLVVWDPEAEFRVEPAGIHHRHRMTPYEGRTLAGVVKATYLRGEKVFESGAFPGAPGGRCLTGASSPDYS
ncbi:MAG: allantoinase AllB [Planctomycetes bacterium]|nr:allantoinase AllB [Planctomycetota bacterium]